MAELPTAPKLASLDIPAKPKEPPAVAIPGMGLSVSGIDAAMRDKYHLTRDQQGVVITDVGQDSIAARRGVQPGDVIIEVQQHAVHKPQDVLDQIASVRREKRQNVLLLLHSSQGARWVPLPLTAAPAGTQKG